jgi:hypothetical protein
MNIEDIIKQNRGKQICPFCNNVLISTTFRKHLVTWECHLNNGTKRKEHDNNIKQKKQQKKEQRQQQKEEQKKQQEEERATRKAEKQHFCKICNKHFEGLNFCKETHGETHQHKTNTTKLLQKIEDAKKLLKEWEGVLLT